MADGTKKLYSQFSIQVIVSAPCNARFEALLNQTAILKRAWDSDESVRNTNEWGEVIFTYPTAPVINSALKIRIDPERRTSEGFRTEPQGGVVVADYLAFTCPGIDIRPNDEIFIGTRSYKVLLVDELFGRSKSHHLQIRLVRIDNL